MFTTIISAFAKNGKKYFMSTIEAHMKTELYLQLACCSNTEETFPTESDVAKSVFPEELPDEGAAADCVELVDDASVGVNVIFETSGVNVIFEMSGANVSFEMSGSSIGNAGSRRGETGFVNEETIGEETS